MVKRILLFSFIFLCIDFKQSKAQIVEPIHWSFSTNRLSVCEFELIINATLEDNWHLYGQQSSGPDGPVPTTFRFHPTTNYELLGNVSEETLIKKFEPVFEAELNYFEHKASFRQKIRIKSDTSFKITGELEFMVCNDVKCIPPATHSFSFAIDGAPDCTDKQGESGGTAMGMNLFFFMVMILLIVVLWGTVKIPLPLLQKEIPKSMGWITPLRIAAGFLTTLFALKFASNVDIILKTAIITREIFISFMIVIVGLLGIYLLGRIKFSFGNQPDYLTVPRLFSAILVLAFTIYLIPGLWGAPLKIIRGFLPPDAYRESSERIEKSVNVDTLLSNKTQFQ